MKQLIYVFLIIMPIIGYGCASSQNSMTESDSRRFVESTENDSLDWQIQEGITTTVRKTVEAMEQRLSELNWNYSKTSYSVPDSLGKQFPMQVETGIVHNQQQAIITRSAQLEILLDEFRKELLEIKSKLKVNEQVREVVKVEEKRISWWEQMKIRFGGIAIMAFLAILFRLLWITKKV